MLGLTRYLRLSMKYESFDKGDLNSRCWSGWVLNQEDFYRSIPTATSVQSMHSTGFCWEKHVLHMILTVPDSQK